MISSPSTVISAGFGTFGDVGLVITDGFGTGASVPVVPSVVVSGVRGKAIRLRDVENREDLADFIKAQMNLKHADLVPDAPKPKARINRKVREAKELEARALENMAIERAQEERRELIGMQNNDILTLLILSDI